MPTTSVEKLSPTRAKLTISVTPEELKPSIAHAYEHIAEQINVPGFRKGKVPPPIIDQRVGKAAVLEHAVNEGLDGFYRAAVTEHELRPLGRPEADIVEWPNEKDFSGDLLLAIEVDVRPEIELPDYDGLELTVDSVEIGDDEVTEELDRLRSRFGTLITVDRPATTGDFVTLDLVAVIDDTEVDTASGISYELGSGELLEGIDEALESLTAGETTTFESKLLGGDHEGETAEITVTVTAVKERELPEADDDFAQIASEFDTLDELTASLKEQVARNKSFGQGTQARDLLVDKLVELADVPVADSRHRGRGAPSPRVRGSPRGRRAPRRGHRVQHQGVQDADRARRDRRGREGPGQPGRAHPVPRAGRRAVRHGPQRVRAGPEPERPDPGHGRRGRAQQGARDRARQGQGHGCRGQRRRPLRVHRRGRRRRGRRRGPTPTPPRRPPRRRSPLASAPPRRRTPSEAPAEADAEEPKKPARKRATKKADAE